MSTPVVAALYKTMFTLNVNSFKLFRTFNAEEKTQFQGKFDLKCL